MFSVDSTGVTPIYAVKPLFFCGLRLANCACLIKTGIFKLFDPKCHNYMISYRTSKFNSTHEFKSSDTMGAFYLENTIANLLSNKLLFSDTSAPSLFYLHRT